MNVQYNNAQASPSFQPAYLTNDREGISEVRLSPAYIEKWAGGNKQKNNNTMGSSSTDSQAKVDYSHSITVPSKMYELLEG